MNFAEQKFFALGRKKNVFVRILYKTLFNYVNIKNMTYVNKIVDWLYF